MMEFCQQMHINYAAFQHIEMNEFFESCNKIDRGGPAHGYGYEVRAPVPKKHY